MLEIENEKFLKTIRKYYNIGGPTIQDMVMFSRQMHSLIRAGVAIVRSIRVVSKSSRNKQLQEALAEVIAGVEHGQTLSVSMRRFPHVFPTLMIALISVGESAGKLDEVFKQLAVHFSRDFETKKQIKSATRYPMMVIAVISVAVGVINLVVVPAFADFFKNFDAELPLPTRILIGTSDFAINYWQYVLLIIFSLIFSWIGYIRTEPGRMFLDRSKLKIPVVGSLLKEALLARFSRAFALSIRTGVPLLDSIKVVAMATDNVYVADKILGMRDFIERGESLTLAAENTKMFSQLVLQMMAIGEETGEVDKLLDEVALFYEEEVEYRLKRLGDSIEPILIVVVAGLVLVLALGIFLPMWDISNVALG